jgi:hypothetical protein
MSSKDYGLDGERLRKAIHIDTDQDYMLGDDQAFFCYPVRFPTVEFTLAATTELCEIVDAIRKERGYLPMLEDGGDSEGWYDVFLGLNGYTDTHMDTSIMAVVVNSDSEDNEDYYLIDLSEDEQREIYAILDDQCKRYYEKSCADLLEEARREMEADV